jgi:hypothetical protein
MHIACSRSFRSDLRVRSGKFSMMNTRGVVVGVSSLLRSRKYAEIDSLPVHFDRRIPFAPASADAFEA